MIPRSNPAQIRCPNCYSLDVRFSLRTKLDWLFGLLQWRAFRCRSCRHRFHKRLAQASRPAYIS